MTGNHILKKLAFGKGYRGLQQSKKHAETRSVLHAYRSAAHLSLVIVIMHGWFIVSLNAKQVAFVGIVLKNKKDIAVSSFVGGRHTS